MKSCFYVNILAHYSRCFLSYIDSCLSSCFMECFLQKRKIWKNISFIVEPELILIYNVEVFKYHFNRLTFLNSSNFWAYFRVLAPNQYTGLSNAMGTSPWSGHKWSTTHRVLRSHRNKMSVMPKCMSCHKAIVVITGRTHCFPDSIYIMLILRLWDLSTLCVVNHLWPLILCFLLSLFSTLWFIGTSNV